jgi:hypothetical protein
MSIEKPNKLSTPSKEDLAESPELAENPEAEEVSVESSPETVELSGIEAEGKKIKELDVLNVKAKEVATQDRAKADALLTDMKDGRFTTTRDNRDFLQERVRISREEVMDAQEELANSANQMTRDSEGNVVTRKQASREILDQAMGRWRATDQELQGHETGRTQSVVESLAHEKDPIAHEDYKEEEAGQVQNFLRTTFPWFLPVWTAPKKIFRRDRGDATPGGGTN